MTLIQLEYILAIYDCGSFVEAAQKSNVTQPALTTQVKNLEKELDVVIFDRTKKPIAATAIGEQIIEQARDLVKLSKNIPDLVNVYNDVEKGDLTLGIIPTIAPYLVPLFVNSYNDLYKEVNLNVKEEITENVLAKLKTGELDAGIIATPVDAKGVVSYPLYYEQFFAFVSPLHPFYYKSEIEVEDINTTDIWLLSEGNCFRNQVINICDYELQKQFKGSFRYESNSIESLKMILDVKPGMTLLPELATLNVRESKREMIKPIAGNTVLREVSLVVSRDFLKRKLLRNLKDCIQDALPKQISLTPIGEVIDPNVHF